MMESDKSSTLIELRSRNRIGYGQSASQSNTNASTSGWAKEEDRVYIDHVVQPSDNLYKVGLQYSVPVSEIKRANNIVADQEIHGLKVVRVPVTRLRQHYLNEKQAMQQQANEAPIIDLGNASTTPQVAVSDKLQLLGDSSDEGESDETSKKSALDAILTKADTTVAHCRNQLPSPSLETGAFHFVNASAPDNTIKGTWMLVIGVVFMFVIIPLILTMLEETHEANHPHQIHSQFSST